MCSCLERDNTLKRDARWFFLVMKYPICIVLFWFEQVTFGGHSNTCEGNTLNQDQFFLCCWFHVGLGLTIAALLDFLVSNSCWKKTTPIDRKDIHPGFSWFRCINWACQGHYFFHLIPTIWGNSFNWFRTHGLVHLDTVPPSKCHPWLALFNALENCGFVDLFM